MKVRPALLLVCLASVLVQGLGGGGEALARRGKGAAHSRRDRKAATAAHYHLKRANALAGQGKCVAAVREYTAAYESLEDPVVLFNRADCYRRLGQNEKAAEDYRAFLDGFPNAPNRSDIEARIAALEKPPEPPAAPARAKEQPKVEERAEVVPRAEPHPPVAVAPLPAAPPKPAPPVEVLAAKEPTPAPPAPVLVAAADEPVVASSPSRSKGRRYWWIWLVASAVVAGGGTTAYLVLRPHPATIPPTDLGNYHF